MAVIVDLSPITTGYNVTKINNNFDIIKNALANEALGLSGSLPNSMRNDLDLNSNDILNVRRLDTEELFVDGIEYVFDEIIAKGDKGWSPTFALESDGDRRVLKLVDYIGGDGTKPTDNIGEYVGATGYVVSITDGVNVRGPQGASGPGTGDLLAVQNLSDLDNAATSFDNIKQNATNSYVGAVKLATNPEAVGLVDTVSALTASGMKAILDNIFIGMVFDYSGPHTNIPPLFILPHGQAISRTTYSAYFAKVGTTYGAGDGATTFNVPDLRGRVVAGKDNMGGTSANRLTNQSGGLNGDVLGAAGGAETHSLTGDQNGPHTHGVTRPRRRGANGSSTDAGWDAGDVFLEANRTYNSNSSGSGQAHNNVQPTFILNKLIYVGA